MGALRFTDEPMGAVYSALAARVAAVAPGGRVAFEAPDPDLAEGRYDGERCQAEGWALRARGIGAWVTLAEAVGAALLTPERVPGGPFVRLRLRRLDPRSSWHRTARPAGHPEKYGADSEFARTDKFEDAAFLRAWLDAVAFLAPPPGARVLSVGCHTGAELGALAEGLGPEARLSLVGVDHSATAIAAAQARYPGPAFDFRVGDLADVETLALGRFDLIIAINVLHSPNLPSRDLFRRLVADHLTERGGLLLGFPNCRYVDHTLVYGAAARHAAHPELSVLLTDVSFHRRYLHQHRFRTTVTGKNTLLLAARRLPPKARAAG